MTRAAPTSCKKVRAQLALAASHDLSEAGARDVWSHLAACLACRREYSSYLELRSALTTLTPEVESRGRTRFFEDLHDDILDRVRDLEMAAPRPRFGVWIGAAAACLLFAVGILVVPRGTGTSPGLLERAPIESPTPRASEELVPLFCPQGLGARRQVDLLFDPDRDQDGVTTFASYRPGRGR